MTNKKRTSNYIKSGRLYTTVIVLFAISVAITLYMVKIKNSMLMEMEIVENKIERIEQRQDMIKRDNSYQLLNTLDVVTINQFAKDVIFSNYGTWDSHSGNKTASGLTINEFEVNEDGMYTYQNKVVLATANIDRLPRKLLNSYNSHLLYEEIDFVIDDKQYSGIVLDVCGACYGVQGEDKQRYDIFTTSNVIGLKEGFIYE